MQQVPIQSRLIASVAYDEKNRSLHVWLRNKRHVTHHNISEAVYNHLVSAESAGLYYTYYIARRERPIRSEVARTAARLAAACMVSMVFISISATSISSMN